ncbi:hypothetical protein V5O48_013612, partial [Marasmius crinis-equi]
MADQSYFTNLGDIGYSAVEYIPDIGMLYSIPRASTAYREGDHFRMWGSMANAFDSTIRDVVLLAEDDEPATVVVFHARFGGPELTDELLRVFSAHHDRPHQVTVKSDNIATSLKHGGLLHFIISSSSESYISKDAQTLLGDGRAKGTIFFHDSVFHGDLVDSELAPGKGERIYLHLPDGLQVGKKCLFSWKWTRREGEKGPKHIEETLGTIRLDPGSPTGFGLSTKQGHWDFWGKITSRDVIEVHTSLQGRDISIAMTRVVP